MWGQTIEREDEHVAPADVATAELGKRVAQTLVFPLHDFQGHVGYNHAATSSRFVRRRARRLRFIRAESGECGGSHLLLPILTNRWTP